MYRKYLVEGEKLVLECLLAAPEHISSLVAVPDWIAKHGAVLDQIKQVVQVASEKDLERITTLSSPPPVAVMMSIPASETSSLACPPRSIYLDNLQDPGNVGTILRIADWFGWEKVFLGPTTCELHNPKVIQASMGAFLRVPTEIIDWPDLNRRYPDLKSYGTVIEGGKTVETFLPSTPFCLVIGHESKGMAPELQVQMHGLLSIPRGTMNSGAESLNAAVATGILCAFLSIQSKTPA